MSNKVTFRLPSKTIQYGYAEVELDSVGPVDYKVLGEDYLRYVDQFHEGEKRSPKSVDTAAQEEFERQLGATKISEESATEAHGDAPWKKKTEASKKPWEKKSGPKPDLFS